MNLKHFKKIVSETPEDVREHIKFSMDVMDRIHELLDKKFDGKQKLLAEKMGKTEAEISKWFSSGIQNFTTKTLIKLQMAFGEPIIAVCTDNDDNATFEKVCIQMKQEATILKIDAAGALKTEKNEIFSARNLKKLASVSIEYNGD